MYEIYINKPTRKITLHVDTCSKIHQHGKDETSNGKYIKQLTLDEAQECLLSYVKKGYTDKECSFCMTN